MRKAAVVVVLGVALASCGDGGTTSPVDTATLLPPIPSEETTVPSEPFTSSTTPSTTTTSGATTGGEPIPVDLLEPLLLDAANRTGVAVGDVSLIEAEFRDFSDSSLGCPQPGMLYTQVITPGYRVVLEAGGSEYDYRMSRRGTFRLCNHPAIPDIRTPSTVIPKSSTVAGD